MDDLNRTIKMKEQAFVLHTSTSETPPAMPGFCDRLCQAELRGWYCHECPGLPHVEGTTNDGGDLVHLSANGEHKFCKRMHARERITRWTATLICNYILNYARRNTR